MSAAAAGARYVLTWRHEQQARELLYRWGACTARPGCPGGLLGRSMAKALCAMLRLLDHGDATISAGLAAIARHAGCSIRTVQRAVDVAERAGVLEIARYPRERVRTAAGWGWRSRPNAYRIRLDVLERLAAGGRPILGLLAKLAINLRSGPATIPAAPTSVDPRPTGHSGQQSLHMIQETPEPGKAGGSRLQPVDSARPWQVAPFDFAALIARLRGDRGASGPPDQGAT